MPRTKVTLALLLLIGSTLYGQELVRTAELAGNTPITIYQKAGIAGTDLKAELPLSDQFEENNLLEVWEVRRNKGLHEARSIATSPSWFRCLPSSFYGNGQKYIHTGGGAVAISSSAPDFTWLISKQSFGISAGDTLSFWMYYLNNPSQGITTNFHVVIIDSDTDAVIDTLGSWGDVPLPKSNKALQEEVIPIEPPAPVPSPSNLYQSRVSIALDSFQNQNVRIAFVHENRNNLNKGYNMAIDNITLGFSSIPRISVRAKAFNFSEIPFSLADTISFTLGVSVLNTGSDFVDGLMLSVSIPALDHTQTIQHSAPIPSGTRITVNFPQRVKFTSINPRDFEIIYSISSPNEDYIERATDTLHLATTQTEFSTHYDVIMGVALGSGSVSGNLYPISKPLVATSVNVGWYDLPAGLTSLPLGIRIYQVSPLDNGVEVIYSGNYTRTSSAGDTTYTIDPTYLTPGFNYFFGIEQLTPDNISIGSDGRPSGAFWRVSPIDPSIVSMLSSSTIGNLAISANLELPDYSPTLNFTVTHNGLAVESATIHIESLAETFLTSDQGKISIPLPNGRYSYTIAKPPYAPIHSTVRIYNADVNSDVSMKMGHEVTLRFTERTDGVSGGKGKSDVSNTTTTENVTPNPIPLKNIEVYVNNLWYTTDSLGVAVVIIPQGANDLNAMGKGYAPLINWPIHITSDSSLLIELEKDSLTYNIDVQIIGETLRGYDPMEKAYVYLAGYGTKRTSGTGFVRFSGIQKKADQKVSLGNYGYIGKTRGIDLASDTLLVDTLTLRRFSVLFEIQSNSGPVNNANVSLGGEAASTPWKTDINGLVQVGNVAPNGAIPYRISKSGFRDYIDTLSVTSYSVRVLATLDSVPPPPDPPDPPSPPDPNTTSGISSPSVSIYPNPTTGMFTVESEGLFGVEIYTLSGQQLGRHINGFNSLTVNLTNHPPGVYIVRIVAGPNAWNSKVIKR